MTTGRILIFIVPSAPVQDLTNIISRVAEALKECSSFQILCFRNTPENSVLQEITACRAGKKSIPITILPEDNSLTTQQRQKIAYRFAIDHDLDFAVQYCPEQDCSYQALTDCLALWEKERPDVVLLSSKEEPVKDRCQPRLLVDTLCQGLLSRLQCLAAGQDFTRCHDSLRGYSIDFLRQSSFELNSDNPAFDLELLFQAKALGAKILELPLQSEGFSSALPSARWRLYRARIIASAQFLLSRYGMFSSLKYRGLRPTVYLDKVGFIYSSHRLALDFVRKYRPKRLLDIGCGQGAVAQACTDLDIEVHGIDLIEPALGSVKHYWNLNLETDKLPFDCLDYDLILILDLIEHLSHPEEFLLNLKNSSSVSDQSLPRVIFSTPNVAFLPVRISLLLGRFNYAERGILDLTHKRLFTRSSLLKMLNECGYLVEQIHSIGAPFEIFSSGRIARLLSFVSTALARFWPSVFAFQFLLVCRPRPGVRTLLADAKNYCFVVKERTEEVQSS